MEQFLKNQNKEKNKYTCHVIGFSILASISMVTLKYIDNPFLKVLVAILFISSVFYLLINCLYLFLSFNSKNYFPNYKVGDVVIAHLEDNPKLIFSQYDEIIAQIPQYQIKDISYCSYLLVPYNFKGEIKEAYFKEHSRIFSVEEFKQRAQCC